MSKNNCFDFFGEDAPFGDDIENTADSTECKCEKGYKKLCKGCIRNTPESMKSFIDEEVNHNDEIYYCFWCDFIQSTGIDESIMKQKADAAKPANHNDHEEEGSGSDAMWELEDAGAFSDEGIMPGCHSQDWEYEMEAREIAKEFKDMEFVGNLLKTAREKLQISSEELARRLKIPGSFIIDLESGQYINRHGDINIDHIMPAAVPIDCDNSYEKKKVKREWWQDCDDSAIREKIADYLSHAINPPVDKN